MFILKGVKGGVKCGKPVEWNNAAPKAQVIDRQVFFEEAALYGEEVFLEIISDFSAEYPQVLRRIEERITNADLTGVERELHKFAGTLSSFHCGRLVDAVRDLEQRAVEKDIDGLKSRYPALKYSIELFMDELDEVRKILQGKSMDKPPER